MKITSVEAIPFNIPYYEAVHFATGVLTAAEHVLIRVRTDEGLVGQAEAPSRPMIYGESQASIVAAIKLWFEPALVGLDPFEVERANQRSRSVLANHTTKGALDMALHDLIGQAVGQPCYRLLGGWTNRLTATHILGLGPPARIAEEALAARERHGFRAFKLKVGKDPARDVAMCRAVREAVGPEVTLYADANHGYAAEQAVRALRAMVEYDIAWVEEPSPAEDRTGRRMVARSAAMPVLGDESCTTLAEVARELTDETCRIVSIKVARTGFATSTRILGLCEGLGARALMGSQGDSMIGTLCTLAFGAAHETTASMPAELSYFLGLKDDLLAEPLTIRDGTLTVPERPGLGIAIDEEKLARYRVEF